MNTMLRVRVEPLLPPGRLTRVLEPSLHFVFPPFLFEPRVPRSAGPSSSVQCNRPYNHKHKASIRRFAWEVVWSLPEVAGLHKYQASHESPHLLFFPDWVMKGST